jgi:hypothetical protein
MPRAFYVVLDRLDQKLTEIPPKVARMVFAPEPERKIGGRSGASGLVSKDRDDHQEFNHGESLRGPEIIVHGNLDSVKSGLSRGTTNSCQENEPVQSGDAERFLFLSGDRTATPSPQPIFRQQYNS